jgi:hypothetical protein
LKVEQLSNLDAWLRSILWNSKLPSLSSGKATDETANYDDIEIHRLKARIPLSNGHVKIVQGVREVFEILDTHNSHETTSGTSLTGGKIVLIGRNLPGVPFEESFVNTISP